MADVVFVIPSEYARDAAARAFKREGYTVDAPPRRLTDKGYPLRVVEHSAGENVIVERMVHKHAPTAVRRGAQ